MAITEAASVGTDSRPPGVDYDVVIIGAGIAGIHQLYKLKGSGLSVRVLEAGTGVGGTWYWNRYPLARFDSESYSYGYFFSKELLQEWEWSEHFAGQPETERYLNFVVDRFDLRADFQFGARVESAAFDEADDTWTLHTSDGGTTTARFVIAATGLLSAPFFPEIPGRDDFKGESLPHGPVAQGAGRLRGQAGGHDRHRGQRRTAPAGHRRRGRVDHRVPAHPELVRPAQQRARSRPRSRRRSRPATTTSSAWSAPPSPVSPIPTALEGTFEDTKEQRWAFYEELYGKRGFAKLFSNYNDILVDPKANAEFCEFLADKIRERVDDPATADKLIPTDHGYGMKRPPMETDYYEAYNRPNVKLVDLRETPIERITETGIVTSEGEEPFDMIIWATGFDAVTGALTRMGLVGTGGQRLEELWADGPHTYLGVSIPRFPNVLFVGGPHFPFANVPRGADIQVDFVAELVRHVFEHGVTRVEPQEAAAEAWTEHVLAASTPFLVAETSWFRGANIPGKADAFMLYIGGLVIYGAKLDEVAANGYEGFLLGEPATVG